MIKMFAWKIVNSTLEMVLVPIYYLANFLSTSK